MARGSRATIKLFSSAGTGHFYSITRNKRGKKIKLKKFDPKIRKHVFYVEGK